MVQEVRQERPLCLRAQSDDGKRTGKSKGTVKKFDDNCRNCGKYGHRTETCWTTFSTKPTEKGQGSARKISKRMFSDEQEKADEDAEKDIRELSDALCPVSFNVIPDEVQNDWNCGQICRSGRYQEAKIHADHVEEPTNTECCRRVLDPEASDESTHAVENHQQQRETGPVGKIVKNIVTG